jgi:hypothetical protein
MEGGRANEARSIDRIGLSMAARPPGRSITADSGFELMDPRIDPDLRFNSRAAKPQLASNAAEDRGISGISPANHGCQ